MAKKKPKQCAYCGNVTHDWDWDHPVPQCLWGDNPLPPLVITVPCCVRCNIYWSLHDGYFRTMVAIRASRYGNKIMKELLHTKVKSHFETDAKLSREWYGSRTWVPKYNEHGLYVGETNQNTINADRLFLIIGKIVRGIFFHHKGRPLPPEYAVWVCPNANYMNDPRYKEVLADLGDTMNTFGGDDEVFMGQNQSFVENRNLVTCQFYFYNAVGFFAQTIRDPAFVVRDLSHPLNVARHVGVRDRRKKWRKDHPFT